MRSACRLGVRLRTNASKSDPRPATRTFVSAVMWAGRLHHHAGPLVAFEARRAEHEVTERATAQPDVQRRRVVQGLARETVEPCEPGPTSREIVNRRGGFLQCACVPLGEHPLGLERLVFGGEVAPRLADRRRTRPVLVEEPDHLARMAYEVTRKIDGDRDIRVDRNHAPRECGVEEPFAVPRRREGAPVRRGVQRTRTRATRFSMASSAPPRMNGTCARTPRCPWRITLPASRRIPGSPTPHSYSAAS